MNRFVSVLIACAAFAGCAKTGEPPFTVAATKSDVVFGPDDRVDYYAETNVALQDLLSQSVVAMLDPTTLLAPAGGMSAISTGTLGYDNGLCTDQLFRTQPDASQCSATLIDDDLVLTAGHCVEDITTCRGYRYVFGYYMTHADEAISIPVGDIYNCRRVVAQHLDNAIDFAIVQLDRPVDSSKVPAHVRRDHAALSQSEPVTMIGFPNGLPGKIAENAIVNDPRIDSLDYFEATVDAFGGNSGSGIFDSSHNVVGVLVRGLDDYVARGSCDIVNDLSDDAGVGDQTEDCTYSFQAIEALCNAGWPSARLCDTPAVCGDALCSGTETSSTCSADCHAPRCGDAVCDPGEDGVCTADCPTSDVPDSWTCSSDKYADSNSCDCNCGAWDPDCGSPTATLAGCAANQQCSTMGTCFSVPAAWSCAAENFASGGPCDCECGAYDPDCENHAAVIIGCRHGLICSAGGSCVPTSYDGGIVDAAVMDASSSTIDGGVEADAAASLDGGLVAPPKANGGCSVAAAQAHRDNSAYFAALFVAIAITVVRRKNRE